MISISRFFVLLLFVSVALVGCGEADGNATNNKPGEPAVAVEFFSNDAPDGKDQAVEDRDNGKANAESQATEKLIEAVKKRAADDKTDNTLTVATIKSLVVRLKSLDLSKQEDRDVLDSTKQFVAGDLKPAVFAAYLKTVLREPWRQQLIWLTDQAKQGNKWACFYLVEAYQRATMRTTYVPPRVNVPAPESAEPYRQACVDIVEPGKFLPSGKSVEMVLDMARDSGHEPTSIKSIYFMLKLPVPEPPADRAALLKLMQAGLKSEHPMVMAALAYEMMHAPGVKKDYVKGLELARKAYDGGSGWAASLLGFAYRYGFGVEKDLPQAISYFRRGVALGEASSLSQLAQMYDKGEVFAKSRAKALELFREAAVQGDGFARQQLGWASFRGDGVKQDKVVAANWWMGGANAGDIESIRLTAWTRLHGVGTKENYPEARNKMYPIYYSKSATPADIKAWADRYRKAKWVTSREITGMVKAVRVEVTADESVSKFYRKADFESAVMAAARARGMRIDPKASALLKVEVSGELTNNNAYNHAVVLVRLFLPGTIWREGKAMVVDMLVRSNQQAHQMPSSPWRGADIRGKAFHLHVGDAVRDALAGSAKMNAALLNDRRAKSQAGMTDHQLYIDYHAAKAVAPKTKEWALHSLPNMADPQIRFGGNRSLVDIHDLQRFWKRELTKQGAAFDPQSSTRIDHLIVAVTNSVSSSVSHVISVVTILESDVLYELDGKFVRHQGWLMNADWSSVGKGNVNNALEIRVGKWIPVIIKALNTKK